MTSTNSLPQLIFPFLLDLYVRGKIIVEVIEEVPEAVLSLAFHALVTLGMPGLMRFLTCTSHGVVHCTSKNQINQEQLQEKCRREVGVMSSTFPRLIVCG